jgi:hypothetical protein
MLAGPGEPSADDLDIAARLVKAGGLSLTVSERTLESTDELLEAHVKWQREKDGSPRQPA